MLKYKFVRLFLISCVSLLLFACGETKLKKLESNDVIVAFGDSLTVGLGTEIEHSYPSVLSELSGVEVINAGVSGETTAEGLIRLPKVISESSPNILILLEGGNDILRNQNYSEIKRNLEEMIQLALSSGIQVVLIGVPEKSLFSSSAPFYDELAEKYDLVYDADAVGSLMRSPSKKSDAIHFNREGYALLAENIYELLLDHGAF